MRHENVIRKTMEGSVAMSAVGIETTITVVAAAKGEDFTMDRLDRSKMARGGAEVLDHPLEAGLETAVLGVALGTEALAEGLEIVIEIGMEIVIIDMVEIGATDMAAIGEIGTEESEEVVLEADLLTDLTIVVVAVADLVFRKTGMRRLLPVAVLQQNDRNSTCRDVPLQLPLCLPQREVHAKKF